MLPPAPVPGGVEVDDGLCRVYLARLAMMGDDRDLMMHEREQSRAARYRFVADRNRFMLGAWLLRAAGGHVLGVPPESIVVDRSCDQCGEPHGRPRLVGTDVHASVSHAGDVVAVAVTSVGPVGVDVEPVVDRTGSDYRELCESVCTAGEQPFVTGREAFLSFWTRKEAVLKATGDGLRVPMTDVVVAPPEAAAELISFKDRPLLRCRMSDFDAGAGHRAAVAVITTAPVEFVVVDVSQGFG